MNYSVLIQWSEVDRCYLVTIPEFETLVMQPCTSGLTYQDAIANAQDCIEACLEHWSEEGIQPPVPKVFTAA